MGLLFISFFIIKFFPSNSFGPKKRLRFNINLTSLSPQSLALYEGMMTGNKEKISKKVTSIFKRYGFMHLLTPSGLHLSSLLVLFKFSSILSFIFIIVFFFSLSHYNAYHSLERVLFFNFLYILINRFLKRKWTIEAIFVLTIIFSILIGHLSQNPLSFCYSLLFWGTIILYKENPIKMLLYLNLALVLISAFMNQAVSPLSILVNPFITTMTTSFFPLLVLNYFLPSFLQFNNCIDFILTQYISFIQLIDRIDIFPSLPSSPLLWICMIAILFSKRSKMLPYLLIFLSLPTQKLERYQFPSTYINLGDSREIMTRKKEWIYFLDRKCKITEMNISCKKRPSNFGGPIL